MATASVAVAWDDRCQLGGGPAIWAVLLSSVVASAVAGGPGMPQHCSGKRFGAGICEPVCGRGADLLAGAISTALAPLLPDGGA